MSAKQIENPPLPAMQYNADLDKQDNRVLFPEKVAKAKANLQKAGVTKLRAVAQQ